MLRKLVLNILILSFLVTTAHAQDVLFVQSLDVLPFDVLYGGFRAAFGSTVKRVVLSDRSADVARVVREERPKVIVAVGAEALSRAKQFRDIPVIYAMVLNPGPLADGGGNVAGIAMMVPAERQLGIFRKVLPAGIRRIGVVYDEKKSGCFVRKAAAAARAAGFELLLREVKSVKELPKAVASLKGSADALWLLPDRTVTCQETVEHLLLFGIENNIPVLAFSAKYVKMGGLYSIDLEPADIGRQAADLAKRAMAGEKIPDVVPPRAAVPHVNVKVARKLGLQIDEETLRKLGAVKVE